MEPITEHRLVSEPIVYGYLRLLGHNASRRAALTLALTSYCDQHELALAGVFADHADDKVLTPAFVGLMDALTADESYGVVLPSPAHMGGKELARPRSEQIAATGRRLMLMRGISTQRPRHAGIGSSPFALSPSAWPRATSVGRETTGRLSVLAASHHRGSLDAFSPSL